MIPTRRERGVALVIVLWAVVMLGAVAASIIASGRNELAVARRVRGAAAAEAAADGAIHRAAFHLLPCADGPGCAPWPTTGAAVDASAGGIGVSVCLADEAGKINPNTADPAVLIALLSALGVARDDAARLGDAIAAWRTPASAAALAELAATYRGAGLTQAPAGQAFATVDDLGLVLGMTPAVLERLRPNLSVWNGGPVNAAIAPPAVRAVLSAPGLDLGGGFGLVGATARTVTATATARTRDGARFTRQAALRLGADAAAPLRVLTWSAAPQTPCG